MEDVEADGENNGNSSGETGPSDGVDGRTRQYESTEESTYSALLDGYS